MEQNSEVHLALTWKTKEFKLETKASVLNRGGCQPLEVLDEEYIKNSWSEARISITEKIPKFSKKPLNSISEQNPILSNFLQNEGEKICLEKE